MITRDTLIYSTIGILFSGAAALAYGFYDAAEDVPVYAPVDGYEVSRRPDEEGADRVYVSSFVKKEEDCDLEYGNGPPWVDFYDEIDGSVPPSSAFYRPDGRPTGNTMGRAGQTIPIIGYSAIVPNNMRRSGSHFVFRIPCQLWTLGPDGNKVWGRKIVGHWGPVPVPNPGTTLKEARSNNPR